MSLHNFLMSVDVCALTASQIIASGAPIALVNCFTAFKTSLSFVIRTILTSPLSVTKS